MSGNFWLAGEDPDITALVDDSWNENPEFSDDKFDSPDPVKIVFGLANWFSDGHIDKAG